MSHADLCKYFNSELQKKGSSDCGNRDCDCLTILSNGQVRSAISRYLSWFWWQPSKYKLDMILFEWYKYSSFVKKSGQGCLRFHNYCLLTWTMELRQSPRQYATTWFAPRVCKQFWATGKKAFYECQEKLCVHLSYLLTRPQVSTITTQLRRPKKA
jgi:hypothetical protein